VEIGAARVDLWSVIDHTEGSFRSERGSVDTIKSQGVLITMEEESGASGGCKVGEPWGPFGGITRIIRDRGLWKGYGRMKRMRGIRIDWRGQEKERANSMSSGVPNRGAKKRIKT
jgi:hypothetical protein